MTDTPAEWPTVAQAAEALGVSVRTLRRLLSEAPFAGRTQAIERHTAKGHRITAMLPPELLADLKAHLHREKQGQAEAGYRGKAEADTEAHSEASRGTPPNPPPNEKVSERASESEKTSEADGAGLPALAYQRVIAALETQNVELRADKERLYAALQLAQENLQREQALRLIGVQRAELTTTGSGAATDAESKDTVTGGKGAEKSAEGQKKGWWSRLWRPER